MADYWDESWENRRRSGKPRFGSVKGVMIHHTEGSAIMGGNAEWSNEKGTGAHYYIDTTGKIIKWADESTVSIGHAGRGKNKFNQKTFRPDLKNSDLAGIEIMTRPGVKPNPAQLAAVDKLVGALGKKHGFTPNDVIAHGEYAYQGHRKSTEGAIAKNIRERGAFFDGNNPLDYKKLAIGDGKGQMQWADGKSRVPSGNIPGMDGEAYTNVAEASPKNIKNRTMFVHAGLKPSVADPESKPATRKDAEAMVTQYVEAKREENQAKQDDKLEPLGGSAEPIRQEPPKTPEPTLTEQEPERPEEDPVSPLQFSAAQLAAPIQSPEPEPAIQPEDRGEDQVVAAATDPTVKRLEPEISEEATAAPQRLPEAPLEAPLPTPQPVVQAASPANVAAPTSIEDSTYGMAPEFDAAQEGQDWRPDKATEDFRRRKMELDNAPLPPIEHFDPSEMLKVGGKLAPTAPPSSGSMFDQEEHMKEQAEEYRKEQIGLFSDLAGTWDAQWDTNFLRQSTDWAWSEMIASDPRNKYDPAFAPPQEFYQDKDEKEMNYLDGANNATDFAFRLNEIERRRAGYKVLRESGMGSYILTSIPDQIISLAPFIPLSAAGGAVGLAATARFGAGAFGRALGILGGEVITTGPYEYTGWASGSQSGVEAAIGITAGVGLGYALYARRAGLTSLSADAARTAPKTASEIALDARVSELANEIIEEQAAKIAKATGKDVPLTPRDAANDPGAARVRIDDERTTWAHRPADADHKAASKSFDDDSATFQTGAEIARKEGDHGIMLSKRMSEAFERQAEILQQATKVSISVPAKWAADPIGYLTSHKGPIAVNSGGSLKGKATSVTVEIPKGTRVVHGAKHGLDEGTMFIHPSARELNVSVPNNPKIRELRAKAAKRC